MSHRNVHIHLLSKKASYVCKEVCKKKFSTLPRSIKQSLTAAYYRQNAQFFHYKTFKKSF